MSVVDDIKDRIDIVDIVGESVKLRKSGRSYTGFCPFHSNTRTPSFVVWPETGTWKCFGSCGTGGDLFSYVMKRDGHEFREALIELAALAGVEVPTHREPKETVEERDRLREAVTAAAQWFNYLLKNNPQAQIARDHLSERGVDNTTIDAFQLGYSLDDWHALQNHLNNKGFTRRELVDSGLLVSRDDGNIFDRFRNRLMIPIQDWKGRPIGFGARTLKGDEHPKYLNSPQTELFDKSNTLYALHAAKKAIREAGQVVIVEGYMDAIAAHQAGFKNIVAALGTALTEMQFKHLQKLSKRIILALDADEAGINAILRGLDVARESLDRKIHASFDARGLIGFEGKLKVDIRVLSLPHNTDPDDVIRREPEQWIKLIDHAKPVVRYVIDTFAGERDLDDPKEKDQLVDRVEPFISDIASPVEYTSYAQYIARLIKMPEHIVIEKLRITRERRLRKRQRASSVPTTSIEGPTSDSRRSSGSRERYCLSEMLRVPHALQTLDQLLTRVELPPFAAEDFDDVAHREVFIAMQAALGSTDSPRVDDVLQHLDATLQEDVQTWLSSSAQRPSIDDHIDEARGTVDAALLLRERNLKAHGAQLEALIRSASDDEDIESLRELSQAKLSLSDQLKRLSRVRYAPELIRNSPSDIRY